MLLIKALEYEKVPILEKVVKFQVYSGIKYKIGKEHYRGYRIDMFFYNEFKDKYELMYFTKKG
ncbi:hypothetical protein [Tepidibacter mesophilus]|uniref:hypothetical protein n=1 Tax=Tepidibacter mesophilus TaxID=655607 RepID=UPI000C0832FA|nr:hypothetical protein [Tepidibacter mesophilus]